ncbi:hypothetical protein AVEN_217182-1, partial [Araneus ventricosus]
MKNGDEIEVPFRNQIRNKGNKIIKDLWQNRWNDSKNVRWTKNLIDKVNVDGLYGDFYINQILTAHGVFREHQARFLEKRRYVYAAKKRDLFFT